MGRLENKIKQILKIQDENERKKEFDEMFSEILEKLKGLDWREKAASINNIDLDIDSKLKFLIMGFFNGQNRSVSFELIPMVINTLIKTNEEEFWNLINDNIETQGIYAEYLKATPTDIEKNHKNEMDKLFSLPEIKEKILDDEELVASSFSRKSDILEKLPKEYGYLISLFDSFFDNDSKRIRKLYNIYFGEIPYSFALYSESWQHKIIKIKGPTIGIKLMK